MEILEPVTVDHMISAFLQAEIDSPRYRNAIAAILRANAVDNEIITRPDLLNPGDNDYRASVLSRYRGYGRDIALFDRFPGDVEWYVAHASTDDLAAVRYIGYSYWIELSRGSRLVRDGAWRVAVENVDAELFLPVVDRIRRGEQLAPPILVARMDWTGLVVLEGHTRLTAYLMDPALAEAGLDVLVGRSSQIEEWGLY